MTKIVNLTDGDLPKIWQAIRALQNATPMNNSSVGRSGFEVYDGGTINVSSGNLVVNGTATISGVLNADGTVTLSGEVNISGPFTVSGDTAITGDLTVTGPTHLNGTTDIAGDTTVTGDLTTSGNLDVDGTLDINGVSTLNNDLTVQGGGLINVGPNMTLNPAVSGGSMQFYSGGGVEGAAGVTAIKGAGNAGLITNTTASVFAASNSVDVSPSAVSITGPVKLQSLSTTGSDANVYFDPSTKQLYYKP